MSIRKLEGEVKLEVAGTGYGDRIDWDDYKQPLEPIGAHPCCGSPERCWACADNEELARIMESALKPFISTAKDE